MRWLLLRFGRAALTLLLLVAAVFFGLAARSDPALLQLGPEASPEALDAFRVRWGLNVSLWEQFRLYLAGLFRFDFGYSYRAGDPALSLVLDRLPATLTLMLPTAAFAIGLGVPLGILRRRPSGAGGRSDGHDRGGDRLAVPNFVVGIFLMYVFSVWLGWLPAAGIVDLRSYAMPVVTMATAEAAIFARFTRSAMVEAMARPMVETARASGLTEQAIRRHHILPNVALPLLTVAGLFLGGLIGASVITETVFAWPGVGRLLVESVAGRDYAVVQCIVLLVGVTMILANLAVDVAYGVLDPRIRDMRR